VHIIKYASPRAASSRIPEEFAFFPSGSTLPAQPELSALESSSASGDVSSAFSAESRESCSMPPLSRLQTSKKSVSFTVPDDLFSESDCAAALAMQQAHDADDEEEHDYARTLAGSLARFTSLLSMQSSFVFLTCFQICRGCCFGEVAMMTWYNDSCFPLQHLCASQSYFSG
jgi:hypothetical protein